MEEVHSGFTQYTPTTFNDWCSENDLEPTTDVFIGGQNFQTSFACSSTEVLNSVFEDLGRSIDEEKGL